MRLANIMQRKVFSVAPSDSLDKAICLMDEHYIHHLPVVEQGRLVGMLSDRDLLIAVGWRLECERRPRPTSDVVGPSRIKDIMTKSVMHLDPDSDIHTAARIMASGKFHAMPIVSGHQLVGLVTATDILQTFYQRQNFASISPRLQELARKRMRINLLTVGPKEYIAHAAKMMHDAGIRHLPVVVDGELVGMLSDHDIRRVYGLEMVEDEKAQARGEFYIGPSEVLEVMSTNVHTVQETDTVMDVIQAMVEHRIGSLPVMRGLQLVGLLTDTDVLRILAEVDEES